MVFLSLWCPYKKNLGDPQIKTQKPPTCSSNIFSFSLKHPKKDDPQKDRPKFPRSCRGTVSGFGGVLPGGLREKAVGDKNHGGKTHERCPLFLGEARACLLAESKPKANQHLVVFTHIQTKIVSERAKHIQPANLGWQRVSNIFPYVQCLANKTLEEAGGITAELPSFYRMDKIL